MNMQVHAVSADNLQVSISVGRHTFLADEPVGIGDDAGPDPYGILLAALGVCKVMTVQMYARRKGWSLESVQVTLDTHKVYARDCEDCVSDPDAKVDIIECRIRFAGELNAEQLDRLTDISERCPVHRTLTNETRIRTIREE